MNCLNSKCSNYIKHTKSLFVLILLAPLTHQANCTVATYTIIRPHSQEQLAPIIKRIKEQHIFEQQDVYGHWHSSMQNAIEQVPGYVADINNDGKFEYIFLDHQGSLNVIAPFICVEDGKQIRTLDIPYTCEGGYLDAFINQCTGECEFLVTTGGATYLCFNGNTREEPTRDVCLWKNEKISLCCDPFWIKEQRNLFKDLYNSKQYLAAYTLLNNFEQTNRPFINKQIDLLVINDSALAMLKNECPYTSLKIIEEIKSNSAFAYASANLKRAIKTNVALCYTAIEEDKQHGSQGKYDYSWLLSHRNSNGVVRDKRSNTLFNAIIPDISLSEIQRSLPLSAEAKNYLYGPGERKIIADRYVSFDGFYPHNATARGLIWCDVDKKISAAAFNTSHNIFVVSRSLILDQLPTQFYQVLIEWLRNMKKDGILPSEDILFYDRFGSRHSLKDIKHTLAQ